MSQLDWIAVDWGTSNLRVWGMSSSGTVIKEAKSNNGMGCLTQADFEPALLELVSDWIDGETLIIACGMVGSRQGWAEAPYTQVPCPALAPHLATAPTKDTRLKVHIIPGICQTNPADVMRGEETQIAGFLALNPNWDGVLCLPGSHTKWVHVSADEIVSFQTLMTGELYAAIRTATVLKHSTAKGWDDTAFEQGISDAISRPEKIAAKLFSLRAEGLLQDLSPAGATARLSGLLIGAELATTKPYWLGQNVAVIGESTLAGHYVKALALQGVPAIQAAAERITLAGLTAAHRQLKDTL